MVDESKDLDALADRVLAQADEAGQHLYNEIRWRRGHLVDGIWRPAEGLTREAVREELGHIIAGAEERYRGRRGPAGT